jgi:hypothetical protein
MVDVTTPKLRPFANEEFGKQPQRFVGVHLGQGDVYMTTLDVTSGLLGTNTWGIVGYDPQYAEDLAKNLVLWTARNAGKIGVPN